jgi:hypothetical protein
MALDLPILVTGAASRVGGVGGAAVGRCIDRQERHD